MISKVMLAAALLVGAAGFAGAASKDTRVYTGSDLANKVAHEIRMYSRYSIWDNVNIRVNEGNVELLGQVSQPYKKADLQRIAQSVPGVTSVTNGLEVLPLSNFDNQLRGQVARAILSRSGAVALLHPGGSADPHHRG